ncbi:hypothetical protein [Vibrio alginolyticus]|uniref:hypothetical protein n=1 Tax=Vibrio alginolyticus TaxID=663 RepID=UPI003754F7B6
MDRFTSSIKMNIESENWYGALFMAITMADICGKISFPEVEYAGPRYKKWFDENLAEVYKMDICGKEEVFLSATDCWALRCSMLHAGTDDITEQKAQEVLEKFEFTTMGIHLVRIDGILALDVTTFCNDVCHAVEKWSESVADDLKVQQEIEKLVKIKTQPYAPTHGIQFG